jgi:hypothetical protein
MSEKRINLSFRKLNELLVKYNFNATKIFLEKRECKFIEVNSIKYYKTFYIYIPERYKIIYNSEIIDEEHIYSIYKKNKPYEPQKQYIESINSENITVLCLSKENICYYNPRSINERFVFYSFGDLDEIEYDEDTRKKMEIDKIAKKVKKYKDDSVINKKIEFKVYEVGELPKDKSVSDKHVENDKHVKSDKTNSDKPVIDKHDSDKTNSDKKEDKHVSDKNKIVENMESILDETQKLISENHESEGAEGAGDEGAGDEHESEGAEGKEGETEGESKGGEAEGEHNEGDRDEVENEEKSNKTEEVELVFEDEEGNVIEKGSNLEKMIIDADKPTRVIIDKSTIAIFNPKKLRSVDDESDNESVASSASSTNSEDGFENSKYMINKSSFDIFNKTKIGSIFISIDVNKFFNEIKEFNKVLVEEYLNLESLELKSREAKIDKMNNFFDNIKLNIYEKFRDLKSKEESIIEQLKKVSAVLVSCDKLLSQNKTSEDVMQVEKRTLKIIDELNAEKIKIRDEISIILKTFLENIEQLNNVWENRKE